MKMAAFWFLAPPNLVEEKPTYVLDVLVAAIVRA
jgi:hypothetical protein